MLPKDMGIELSETAQKLIGKLRGGGHRKRKRATSTQGRKRTKRATSTRGRKGGRKHKRDTRGRKRKRATSTMGRKRATSSKRAKLIKRDIFS
jgi:hypothetical protein